MQVTKEGIEAVKSANDLAAVVAERGIAVQRKGRQLVASCPFHQERTASFTVSPGKGLFHCFGCGAAGDVIGFVTKHDKVTFGAALDTLARRAGLDLQKLMKERPRTLLRTPIETRTPPPADLRRPRARHPRPCWLAWSSTTIGPSASGRTPRSTWPSAASRTSISCARSRSSRRTARSANSSSP